MTLTDVEVQVHAMLRRLQRPCPHFRFERIPCGDATPHIENDCEPFARVVSERGQTISRDIVDADTLLYMTFFDATGDLARKCEWQSRQDRSDTHLKPIRLRQHDLKVRSTLEDNYSRATWMDAHARLMGALRPECAARVNEYYVSALKRSPLTTREMQNIRRLDLSDFAVD